MTNKANELLSKIRSEYTSTKTKSFDSMFYIGYDNSVLIELQNEGYIIMMNDIVGTIELNIN